MVLDLFKDLQQLMFNHYVMETQQKKLHPKIETLVSRMRAWLTEKKTWRANEPKVLCSSYS